MKAKIYQINVVGTLKHIVILDEKKQQQQQKANGLMIKLGAKIMAAKESCQE